jgi:hypothetical protein
MTSPRKYMKKIAGIKLKKDLSRTAVRKSSRHALLKVPFMATNTPKPDIIDNSKVLVNRCIVTIRTKERTTETVTIKLPPEQDSIIQTG